MRGLHPFELAQSLATQLAGLYGGVAVVGEIFAGGRVVVDAEPHLGEASAQGTVGVEPVGEEKGRSVVGWLVAVGGGLETQEGKEGECHGLGIAVCESE